MFDQCMTLVGSISALMTIRVGSSKDYPKAAIWFQKAADLNYVPALTQLGVMYNNGFGVPEDHAKAAQFYMKATHRKRPMIPTKEKQPLMKLVRG